MCTQVPPTGVCCRLFVFVGGWQCRYQRLHVHDQVFMAQRVKASTLTKLSSEKKNTHTLRHIQHEKLLCCPSERPTVQSWTTGGVSILPVNLGWISLNLGAGLYHFLCYFSTEEENHIHVDGFTNKHVTFLNTVFFLLLHIRVRKKTWLRLRRFP